MPKKRKSFCRQSWENSYRCLRFHGMNIPGDLIENQIRIVTGIGARDLGYVEEVSEALRRALAGRKFEGNIP